MGEGNSLKSEKKESGLGVKVEMARDYLKQRGVTFNTEEQGRGARREL